MNDFASTPELILLPAVDVAGGKAVRLTQGEAGTETNYGDPVDAALEWAKQGADWIHLVDLDAAFGRGSNAGDHPQGDQAGPRRAGRGLRRHPRRPQPRGRARERRRAHQPRHRGAGEPGVGRRRHRPLRRRDRGRARRARHDPRRARLDAGGRRPLDGARAPRGGRLQPLRRHRRHEGRHAAGAEPRAAARDHLAHDRSRSSPRAASRASTTSSRCATSCRSASRARSSARRSTRVRSRSPRRWMSPDTDPHDHHHGGRLRGRPLGGAPLRVQPALGRRRLGRPGAARRADRLPRRRRRPGRRHRGVSHGAPADPAGRREGRRGRRARTV